MSGNFARKRMTARMGEREEPLREELSHVVSLGEKTFSAYVECKVANVVASRKVYY